jgi:hypothetical protein
VTPSEQAALLALSDERAQWQKYALDLARDAYRDGYRDGRADEARDADRAWAAQPRQRVRDGDALADVEARRWKLRGEQRTRETFGQPHPADYKGQRQERAA